MISPYSRSEVEVEGYLDQILHPVLQAIGAELSAQVVCTFSLDDTVSAEILFTSIPPLQRGIIASLISLVRRRITPASQPYLTDLSNLNVSEWGGALVIPIVSHRMVLGALVMISSPADAYTLDDVSRIEPWLGLIRTVFENRVLQANQAIAQTIQNAAAILGENPSSQDLVNVLRDNLFGPQISSCVMLSFGPLREDRPNGPFEYLQVKGSWSRRVGSGVGLGVRVYLDQYADLLTELEGKGILELRDVFMPESRIDPMVRGFLRAEHVRRVLLIGFGGPGRRLGVFLIASDRPHRFSAAEIRAYNSVIQFLALNVMAHVLQQQHDFVQRGRAALLDAVNDGVLMILPSDIPRSDRTNAHVLTVNRSFGDLFGVSTVRATGLPLHQLIEQMRLPEDVRRHLTTRWLNMPVRDPVTQEGEFTMIHPQGYQAQIEWYSAPVYLENRVLGRIFTFHDLSAERAASSLRANFISRVSHELRTPLTSIKGFAQFMAEEMGDQLPPAAREYAGIILNSARHLNHLFSQIIEITRADSGELTLNLDQADILKIVEDALTEMKPLAESRQQSIQVSVADHIPMIRVDVNRILGVYMQVLKNALLYSPTGSHVRLAVHCAYTVDDLPPGSPENLVLPALLTTVSDEGPGLSAEETVQVFTPFYRGLVAQANKIEGAGLGLTLARSIIFLHGGVIWAEPRRRGRRGARFCFTIPPC